jgi:hypothetical protein
MLKCVVSIAIAAFAITSPTRVVATSILGPESSTSSSNAAGSTVQVIEYYHARLDHYFLTGDPGEVNALDAGVLTGWRRTGESFAALAAGSGQPNTSPVCRFYGRPEAGLDSHFYSASPAECAAVISKFAASWQFETSDMFDVFLPDLATGTCPGDTVAVYRTFNNRPDANHRYTVNPATHLKMLRSGYIAEGYGASGVAFCALVDQTVSAPTAAILTPTAAIAVTQDSSDPLGFAFSAASSTSPNGSLVAYSWDFGDTAQRSGASVSHRYSTAGIYTIKLTVTDARNASGTTMAKLDVDSGSSGPTTPGTTSSSAPGTTAAPGTSTGTTATSTASGTPNGWKQFPTSYASGSEAPNQSWYNLAWDTKRNRAYGLAWDGTLSAFDPATARWSVVSSWNLSGFHNRTITYDPLNDRLWVSDGTGSPQGFQYFDFTTSKLVNLGNVGQPSYEAAMIFDPVGKQLISFGGWHLSDVSTFSLDPIGTSWRPATVTGSGPSYSSDSLKMTAWRAVYDPARQRILHVEADGSLSELKLPPTAWNHLATAGGPPPVTTQYTLDVAQDAIVGWSAGPSTVSGDGATGDTRETWLLPLATLTWTKAASADAGNLVPEATTYVSYAMTYDPIRQQTILHSGSSNYDPHTWAYRYTPGSDTRTTSTSPPTPALPPTPTPVTSPLPSSTPTSTPAPAPAPASGPVVPTTGKITSFLLPTATGGVYGVNYFGFPYTFGSGSKQTNMAYCPLNNRLYVSGGDTDQSAEDGTWSMSLTDGSWRLDVGRPVYPTLPAPSAGQDGALFAWMPKRNKFLFLPGYYFGYTHNVSQYENGDWYYDPIANTWEQHLDLFNQPMGNGTTGDLFGGVYDEVNDQVIALIDDQAARVVRRWDLTMRTRLPDLPLSLTAPAGKPALYFKDSKPVIIGRWIYYVGAATDGEAAVPLMFRWNLDTHVAEMLPPPPVPSTSMIIEMRLATSHGKLVFPYNTGPDGEFPVGILVFDPSTNAWSQDKQVPGYGNFIGNASTSLPDGRVAMSGAAFGTRSLTHLWFYEAQ